MIFLTHISFALLMGLLYTKSLPYSVHSAVFIGIMCFASVFPDIDIGTSLIGRRVRPWNAFFRHRGFFHSIICMIACTVAVFIVFHEADYALAFLLGFASHLALDSLTPAGLALFWPSSFSPKGKFRTGGLFDWSLFFALVIIDTALVAGFL